MCGNVRGREHAYVRDSQAALPVVKVSRVGRVVSREGYETMTETTSAVMAPPARPSPLQRRPRFTGPLAERSVRIALLAWLGGTLLALAIARGTLPFDRPVLATQSFLEMMLAPNILVLETLILMGIVYALTKRRAVPDIAARAPERAIALGETLLLVGYGVAGQIGGLILGRALGWHAISFHLPGTLYGTHALVTPAEALTWAGYNFAVYAVVPFVIFRRRYTAEALNLRSSNRRNDLLVIAVVLLLESLFELTTLSAAILDLRQRQLLLGAPLTFALYFVGTVLPTMVFVYCILVPRYLRLTGSAATTVILGGVTYALLHFFDGWTLFTSPGNAALSVTFLFFQYFAPGMFKTFVTLRTGNAWVHVWSYHAVAPHMLEDTPLIVQVFHLH